MSHRRARSLSNDASRSLTMEWISAGSRCSRRPAGFPSGVGALGTLAVGSLAVAALAIGALAIGALAVGRLEIRKAKLREVEIDDLTVRHLRVIEQCDSETPL